YQTWLITYSGLLGAVGGVIICDYVVIRQSELSLRDLYDERGAYAYTRGVNRRAVVALVAGIAVALAGTLHPGLLSVRRRVVLGGRGGVRVVLGAHEATLEVPHLNEGAGSGERYPPLRAGAAPRIDRYRSLLPAPVLTTPEAVP
ncbi:MAG: cytosine permease, partial [Gemmatimonadales bacterium]